MRYDRRSGEGEALSHVRTPVPRLHKCSHGAARESEATHPQVWPSGFCVRTGRVVTRHTDT